MATTTIESCFGPTLKRFRDLRRFNQTCLGKRAGFDHSYISRLEGNARTPTRDAVEQLAKALGLDDVQRDELLASAGFLPRSVLSLLADEPELGEVWLLLKNGSIPSGYRDNMRSVLRLLAEQARIVLANAS